MIIRSVASGFSDILKTDNENKAPFMNAAEFHQQMAIGLFKPVYPVIVQKIIRYSRLKKGLCLDVGGGTGVLAIELARKSAFKIITLDNDHEAIKIAKEYIHLKGMSRRVLPVWGKAEELPLPDSSINLVVSRNSVFLWKNQMLGMQEIYRVLRPGGFAIVGGGMGSFSLKKEIMSRFPADQRQTRHKQFRKNLPLHLRLMMQATGISEWEMESSSEGTWIYFKKPKNSRS